MAIFRKIFILGFILTSTACSVLPRSTQPAVALPEADTNVQLGLAYLEGGDVQRAKQKLLFAEQQTPTSAAVQGSLGYFYETIGNFSTAERYYRRAVALNAQAGAAQNNYGAFLCRHGRYAEADQHFLLALQDRAYLHTAQVYENAGLCAMQIPDVDKAENYFLQAVQQDPKRLVALLGLSRLSYQTEKYVQAQQYLDRYLQLTNNPTANALYLGAILARKLGKEAEAGRFTLRLQAQFPGSQAYKELINSPSAQNKHRKQQLYY